MEISLENLYVDIGALKRVKYHDSKFQFSGSPKGPHLASSKLVTLFILLQLMLRPTV